MLNCWLLVDKRASGHTNSSRNWYLFVYLSFLQPTASPVTLPCTCFLLCFITLDTEIANNIRRPSFMFACLVFAFFVHRIATCFLSLVWRCPDMYRCLRDVGLAIALLSETGQTIPISDMFDMFAYHVFGTTKCFASLVLRCPAS